MATMFRDRITGRQTDRLETASLFGRWQIACGGEAFLNSFPVQPGHFVVPDAAGEWRLQTQEGTPLTGSFLRRQFLEELEAEAIGTVGRHVGELSADGGWMEWLDVSPLVPRMSERIRLQPFESQLRDEAGFLEEVCQRPRAHLRVEVERTPVSRARRVPPVAAAFLASHTEDWARRKLSTVEPRRILAMVRDDLYDIYENRVAARLVDNLVAYLNRRVHEVRRLRDMFKEAADYRAGANAGYFQRQRRLYELWGNVANADEGCIEAERTLKQLEQLRYRMSGLMDSVLYREVPRRATVGTVLKRTNVLVRDPHYSRVAELWLAWAHIAGTTMPTPRQVYDRNQDQCRNFAGFCALLVVRALDQLGFEPENPDQSLSMGADVSLKGTEGQVTLNRSEDDWTVTISAGDNSAIRFVPLPATVPGLGREGVRQLIADIELPAVTPAATIVLYPTPSSEELEKPADQKLARRLHVLPHELPSNGHTGVGFLPVSPWDIGSVERIARVVRWTVMAPRFQAYPAIVPAPPGSTVDLQCAQEWLAPESGRGLQIRRPPDDHEYAQFQQMVKEQLESLSRDVANLKAEHEQVTEKLREAAHKRKSTQALNARKKILHDEQCATEEAWQRLQEFSAGLEDAVGRVSQLLQCPVCHKRIDPRRAFTGSKGPHFRCRCLDCGASWGTEICGLCRKSFPMLLPRVERWPEREARTPGWVDRFFGCDLLAIPCPNATSEDPSFICPSCGRCSCGGCSATGSVAGKDSDERPIA